MKTCRISKCKTKHPDNVLMCRPHWYKVPVAIRRRVRDACKKMNRGGDRAAYYQAAADAVQAVEEKELQLLAR
ncbi:MAG: hypothetical protein GKR93_11875 [Gammaproteobacteria bacterium]|nr:hypothetical protein [Gammaproteobacteria bacterium]